MSIQTNIRQVLGQLEQFARDVPRDLQREVQSFHWKDLAVDVAQATLDRLASTEQQPYIRGFIRTITVSPAGSGSRWRMSEPNELSEETEVRVAQMVEEWVEKEKTLNERDSSPDQTARRIMGIMHNPSNAGKPEIDALRNAIDRWAASTQGSVHPDLAYEWLAAVLQAWTTIVLETLPDRVLRQIRQSW